MSKLSNHNREKNQGESDQTASFRDKFLAWWRSLSAEVQAAIIVGTLSIVAALITLPGSLLGSALGELVKVLFNQTPPILEESATVLPSQNAVASPISTPGLPYASRTIPIDQV